MPENLQWPIFDYVHLIADGRLITCCDYQSKESIECNILLVHLTRTREWGVKGLKASAMLLTREADYECATNNTAYSKGASGAV